MYPEKHAIQINIKENNMLKRRILSVLLVLAMLVPFAGAAQTAQDNMRGVWVASVANIDYPSSEIGRAHV